MLSPHLKFFTCRPLALLVVFLWVSMPVAAHAHGEDSRQILFESPVGPYSLDVWVSPGIARTGEIHLETLITDSLNRAIRECDVEVTLSRHDQDARPLTAQAGPSEIANGFRQEIVLQIEESGVYQVNLSVLDGGQLVEEITFPLEIVETAGWLQGLIVVEVVISVMFGFWLLRQGWVLWRLQPSPSGTQRELTH